MVEEILSAVDELAKSLKDKGYVGEFYINGSFPGDLRESVSMYLYASLLGIGKANGLSSGYRLTKYLDMSKAGVINAGFEVRYTDGKFQLQSMTIQSLDRRRKLLKKNDMKFWTTAQIPTKSEAIAKVNTSGIKNLKNKSRLKS